jgi:hypothetical protein
MGLYGMGAFGGAGAAGGAEASGLGYSTENASHLPEWWK